MFEKGLADLPEFWGFEPREINAEDFGAETAGEGLRFEAHMRILRLSFPVRQPKMPKET
jgi:hypothetical protein